MWLQCHQTCPNGTVDAVTDHILINDLRVISVIGVLEHERQAPQPLRIDVDIHVDLHDAGLSDDLTETVNYGEVCERLVAIARDHSDLLLERLAQRMADVVLEFPRVHSVDLTLTKVRPPIPVDVNSSAVRIHRVKTSTFRLSTHEAVIALGSNLGDRVEYLRFAVERLGDSVVAQSEVFETDPVGGPLDQGAYLNMVVVMETELDPYALLRWLHRIEADAGRERTVHWGPRTLDLDLLFFDDVVIEGGNVSIPHPRYSERRFVLAPLSQVRPEKCPEGWATSLPPDAVYPRGMLADLK
jgi:dihydroneopterin aldolase/2-amino-4-hydroxy-6-hydroxymethyldihydropteridine diphosphokinase